MHNIPNLFVIGAPKSGTTAFVAYIKQHPDIFVPKIKEPRFFDAHTFFDYQEDYPIKNLEEYLALYAYQEAANSLYRVDGSVFNMYDPESINNILNISPDAKFIVILRDPLSATKSMFSQRMKYIDPALRELSEDFDKCWELMKRRKDGANYPVACRNKFLFRYDLLYKYERYLPFIREKIAPHNLYIASYSDFRNSPETFFKQVYDFLSIEHISFLENKIRNKSFHVKNTLKTKAVSFLISKTYHLRKKIKMQGKVLNIIKHHLLKNAKEAPKISSNSDTDIKKYFNTTYKYLDKINVTYDEE